MSDFLFNTETVTYNIGTDRRGRTVAYLNVADDNGESHCIGMLFGLEQDCLEGIAKAAADGIRKA